MKTRNIVIVTRDIGGTGMGNIGMNAFMFSDNIYELPILSFETAYGDEWQFPGMETAIFTWRFRRCIACRMLLMAQIFV